MKALVYHPTPWRWALCKAVGLFTPGVFYGRWAPLQYTEHPLPTLPGKDWVRLKTTFGGVCGTDLAMVAQRVHPGSILQAYSRFPAVLGHENVAVVEQAGPDAGEWPIGRRVCVDPALGCLTSPIPPCPQCEAGRPSLCLRAGDDRLPPRAMIGLNSLTGGSWGEYFVAHRSQLFAVPDSISDESAILVDPLASAAHGVLRRRPRNGEKVLICGSGIIALGVVAAVRLLGHDNPVTVVVRHPFQAELMEQFHQQLISRRMPEASLQVILMARMTSKQERFERIAKAAQAQRLSVRFGNQMLVGGFDLVYECSGNGAGLTDALKWTRPRGCLVALGTSGITLLETTPLWFDELEVIGSNGRQIEDVDGRRLHTYQVVLDWMRDGLLDVSLLPVSRYPLADYRRAFTHLLARNRHRIIKAVFIP